MSLDLRPILEGWEDEDNDGLVVRIIEGLDGRPKIQMRIEKARGLEDAGKPGQAKIYYQQAATRADGELKKQLLEKVQSLGETK